MSVRDRVPRLQAGDVTQGSLDDEQQRPKLPQRPSTALLDTAYTETVQRAVQDANVTARSRPIVPPKAKSLGGNLTTVPRQDAPLKIQLIDLDDAVSETRVSPLTHLEPLPELEEHAGEPRLSHLADGDDTDSRPPLPARRSPSPLAGVAEGLGKLRVGAPQMFRSVSDGAQMAVRSVQMDTPRAFQDVAANAQKAFGNAQASTPRVMKGVVKGTQKALTDVGAGIKRTVNGIPVPHAFSETREDLSDLAKLQLGQPGVCSKCTTLVLDDCFGKAAVPGEAYGHWMTPLSRIALHCKWCKVCKLLVSMLSRPQHDPLRVSEVRQHTSPDWLKDVPLSEWITKGYIHQDAYWPFGRSAVQYEGSTQVVGMLSAAAWDLTKAGTAVGMEVLARYGDAKRSNAQSKEARNARLRQNRDRLKRNLDGKDTAYPISAMVDVTISTALAEQPGLLWVDLLGRSNKPGAEDQVLSHFMLHAVKDGFVATSRPGRPLSYGHVLDKQWINAGLARLWLTDCETGHGKICSEHGWAMAMQKPGFLRVIDVEEMRVIVTEKPQSCRYVALSYVWGDADVLKLRYSNAAEFTQPGGLQRHLMSLPRTVLDAMQVVRAIGERYLWVDALCILQEQSAESREQIANMDRIYGSALFTIVASQGRHANAGLPGVRNALSNAFSEGTPRQVNQPTAVVTDNIQLIAPFETTKHASDDIWESRAWTFQERLLSRRMLFFADDEMIWHCRGMVAREDMPIGQSGYDCIPLDWLALQPQHLGVGVEDYWKDGCFEQTRHGRTHLVRSATFAEYARMIAQFTQREMSYEHDAVNALAGLLRIFSLAFESECIYGLPSVLLDVALLWRPAEHVQQRDPALGFPTWSWAGWKGRMVYPQPVSVKRDEAGHTSTIEGIQPLLRYFRFDGTSGTLQPLNGTARGLPMTDHDVPNGWDAHPPRQGCEDLTHTCRTPDVFDLDPRTIPHLSDQHLIFWTSTSDNFRVTELGSPLASAPDKAAILDVDGNPVGLARFDDAALHSPPAETMGRFARAEMILMAEAHSSALVANTVDDDFGCYLMMLVKTDAKTGVASRMGLGWMSKAVWIASYPDLKLVCLG